MIFVDQAITLNTTFTEDGTVIDITGGTVEYDYWLPGNYTATPDDSITGSIVLGTAGTATGEFPSALNTAAGNLRVQAKVTTSGNTYRAAATCAEIYPIGAGCS